MVPAAVSTGHQEAYITLKELVPTAVVAALWGPHWVHHAAVVAIINHNDSKNFRGYALSQVSSLLGCQVLKAAHISGSSNDSADTLSRNNTTHKPGLYRHLFWLSYWTL